MIKITMRNAVCLLFVVVFMAAGCAKQDVVKKDEGIVPSAVARQNESDKKGEPKINAAPAVLATKMPVPQTASSQPATTVQVQKTPSPRELQSSLEKIYFDFDSASLSESARSTLSKNAAVLAKAESANIRIEGHCDDRGSAEYNLALGERRARAAQQYLTALGIKPGRLAVVSYGKEKPVVQGDNEEAWSKNRRDEFVISR
jgi:peptidoglycan-associated lipoprotein